MESQAGRQADRFYTAFLNFFHTNQPTVPRPPNHHSGAPLPGAPRDAVGGALAVARGEADGERAHRPQQHGPRPDGDQGVEVEAGPGVPGRPLLLVRRRQRVPELRAQRRHHHLRFYH